MYENQEFKNIIICLSVGRDNSEVGVIPASNRSPITFRIHNKVLMFIRQCMVSYNPTLILNGEKDVVQPRKGERNEETKQCYILKSRSIIRLSTH